MEKIVKTVENLIWYEELNHETKYYESYSIKINYADANYRSVKDI